MSAATPIANALNSDSTNACEISSECAGYRCPGRLFAEIDGTSTVQETLVSTWQSNELSYLSGDTGNTRFSQFDERGNIVATRNESNIRRRCCCRQGSGRS